MYSSPQMHQWSKISGKKFHHNVHNNASENHATNEDVFVTLWSSLDQSHDSIRHPKYGRHILSWKSIKNQLFTNDFYRGKETFNLSELVCSQCPKELRITRVVLEFFVCFSAIYLTYQNFLLDSFDSHSLISQWFQNCGSMA